MWIFQNSSFLSVVAHRTQRGRLLVRSRVEGDIERAIPGVQVWDDPHADYRYRAVVTKAQLKAAMSTAVDAIDYHNFKNSVQDRERHNAYMGVWSAMARAYGAYVAKFQAPPDLSDYATGDDDIDAYLLGDHAGQEREALERVFPGWFRS